MLMFTISLQIFVSSHQSHKKAGTMWREAGLRWKDFLPEDIDVNKFVTEKVRFHSLPSSLTACFLQCNSAL